ncbi:MAG: hypothetical protein OXR66_03405 [Candidatus Woesearchaeota archaeon]|nr:hypothetical protein [Candidatus Woesearchaeota archaeon]
MNRRALLQLPFLGPLLASRDVPQQPDSPGSDLIASVQAHYLRRRAAGADWGVHLERYSYVLPDEQALVPAADLGKELAFPYAESGLDLVNIYADAHCYAPRDRSLADSHTAAKRWFAGQLQEHDAWGRELAQALVPEKAGQDMQLADFRFSINRATLSETNVKGEHAFGDLRMHGDVLLFSDGSLYPIFGSANERHRWGAQGTGGAYLKTRAGTTEDGLPSEEYHRVHGFRREGPVHPSYGALFALIAQDLNPLLRAITSEEYRQDQRSIKSNTFERTYLERDVRNSIPHFKIGPLRVPNEQRL